MWNPQEWPEGVIPRGEVDAAVREIFAKTKVIRMYVDPLHWESQVDTWASDFGDEAVTLWYTNRTNIMFASLVRYLEDSRAGLTTHDSDPTARAHALNARKVAKAGDKFILGKPSEHQKIDILMADVLAHEAAADVRAVGSPGEEYVYVM